MATYNNLTSLEGLQVGDVVNYANSNTSGTRAYNIDLKGYKVKVSLSGLSTLPTSLSDATGGVGGLATAVIDSSKFPDTAVFFSGSGGTSLCYGTSYDKYTRIMVAGDSGSVGRATSGQKNSLGGGLTGSDGYLEGYTVTGGTQTSGGKSGNYGGTIDRNADFGVSGSGTKPTNGTSVSGGSGWYGGGCAVYRYTTAAIAGGGGSGFILGLDGTSYPTGYLLDDADLIEKLKSAISNGVLTQGGASRSVTGQTNYSTMTLTILAEPTSTRNIHYYTGTEFKEAEVYRYNGTLFERVEPSIYTNSQWQ